MIFSAISKNKEGIEKDIDENNNNEVIILINIMFFYVGNILRIKKAITVSISLIWKNCLEELFSAFVTATHQPDSPFCLSQGF